MGLIDNIRIKAGKRNLARQLSKTRDVQSCNWDSASSIGILYKINDERSVKHVKWYMREVKKKYGQKKMFALGYFDEKMAPAYISHGLETDFFLKKDVNWYGKPSAQSVTNFVEEPFDLLIDLTEYECVPLRFVLSESKARFKVGKYAPQNEPFYDLMIATKEEGWNHYMEQLDRYIGMIK